MINSLKCVALLLCSAMLSQATDFQPKVQQSSIRNMVFEDAFEGTSHLLATTEDGLVRSRDNGATWTDASDSNTNSSLYNVNTDRFHNNRAFDVISGWLYMSNDYGANWKRLNISLGDENSTYVNMYQTKTHPLNEKYLIVGGYFCQSFNFSSRELNETSKAESRLEEVCSTYSFLSSNGGETFVKVHLPGSIQLDGNATYSQCEFGRTEKYSQLGDESDVFCMIDIYPRRSRSDTYVIRTFFKTTDFGETVQEIDQFQGQKVQSFKVTGDYIQVKTVTEDVENSASAHVWYSDDGSSFKEARLPREARLPGEAQAFLPLFRKGTLGRRFINSIKRQEENPERCVSELLMSDSTGLEFSKLDLFPTNDMGLYDVGGVEGLDGTIYASFRSSGRSGKIRPVSKMSLDNGKTWRGLQLEDPETKMECENGGGEGATCPSVHTAIDGWSLVSESESAASSGILVAEGSISHDADSTAHPPQSYISRDGGASWSKAFDFAPKFAFGDRGNVIFAVPWDREHGSNETLKAYYSLDRGYAWSEYPLEETLDPNVTLSTSVFSNNLTFTVFVSTSRSYDEDFEEDASDSDTNDIYTNVYVFDFSEVFGGKTCTESDFEYWYQSEGKCVNGAKYKYRRRKADAQCLVNEPFAASEKIEEPCDCTQEDYECAPMFVRDKNGTCVPDESLLKASGACGGAAETAELVPMRLELGNKCVNPLDIEPVQVACGGTNVDNSGSMSQNKDFFEAES